MAVPGLAGVALNTVGEAIAFAAGVALGPTLAPVSAALVQEAWQVAQIKAVDPGTAAEVVAEDVEKEPWGAKEASMHGIDRERFDAIVGEVRNAPGLSELFAMLRRETISAETFVHGLRKGKLEYLWDKPVEDLQHERLTPQELAVMAQRAVVPNDGLLPVTFDNSGSNVTPMPVAKIDTLKEAKASGYDFERMAALARIVGLPPAPGELLQLLNRGTINDAAFNQGISEGNTRNEWADALKTLRRRLLTPHEYQEAALRGVLTNKQADDGSALSGLTAADSKTLFAILGRPLAVHQITTGLARGATYGGTYDDVPEPYRDAIRRSAVRPEYARLDYANRYIYPSPFAIRTLAQTGELSPADVHQTLLEIGWKPELATKVTAAWTGGAKAKSDPHVAKAETQLWTALHKSYVDDATGDTKAHADLTALGVTAAAIPEVLRLWGLERGLVRSLLNPLQIKKAVGQPGRDRAWALTRLEELGYTADDAGTFLDE